MLQLDKKIIFFKLKLKISVIIKNIEIKSVEMKMREIFSLEFIYLLII